MQKLFIGLFMSMLAASSCNNNVDSNNINLTDSAEGTVFNGKWTYRSLFNKTDWKIDFDSVAFAAAVLELKSSGKDSLTGTLLWQLTPPLQGLNITGNYYKNGSVTCYSLTGLGDSALSTAGWQYNYQGYLVPNWQQGVNQATVLVGSVVRSKPHNGQPAGLVASTYMVKVNK